LCGGVDYQLDAVRIRESRVYRLLIADVDLKQAIVRVCC
jgi:hypothetical protein